VTALEEEYETIEFNQKTDLLALKTKCPHCGSLHHGVPYALVSCNTCGITYRTEFNMDILDKKSKRILEIISFKDGLNITATEEYATQLTYARQLYIEQGCYNVSEIERTTEESRKCFNCGVCLNCFTCKQCGKTFTPDRNRRKRMCPTCKSTSFVKTFIKGILISKENRDIMLCPHCKSDNIRLTRTKGEKCHICGSTNLSEVKIDIIYKNVITRKDAYRRNNLGKK